MKELTRKLSKFDIWLFLGLIILYTFRSVNQGVDLTDTGFFCGNYKFIDALCDRDRFSLFISYGLGHVLTCLPFGDRLLAMNIYCSVFKCATAVIAYFFFVRECGVKPWIAGLGELMALGCCWCPSVALYNYLTYLLFNLSAILICLAEKKQKDAYYLLAGICLGANVFVRFPNVVEVLLIFAVWAYFVFSKAGFARTFKVSGLCIGGFAIGGGVPFAYICVRYGIQRYISAIQELFVITEDAEDYTLMMMLKEDLFFYQRNVRWLGFAVVLAVAGAVAFCIAKDKGLVFKRVAYCFANMGLLFVFLAKNMYTFEYYNYTSMEKPAVILLLMAFVICLFVIVFERDNKERLLLMLVMAAVVVITPIGSNNLLYTTFNNLFLVAPLVLSFCVEKLEKVVRDKKLMLEPFAATAVILVCFSLIQGILFGFAFSYRDGIEGERRSAKIESIPSLKGMYTNEDNAKALSELYEYLSSNGLTGQKAILYYDNPGLVYFMGLEPAMSGLWTNLDSFGVERLVEDLKVYDNLGIYKPVLIEGVHDDGNERDIIISDYLSRNAYELAFSNARFKVYR
ncbi:MAG: hypothetical protein HUJ70_10240 [Pseudobutyrivibrio sp.]|nr:hypothetical protein [Pseudobutyrivibrio sp.]